MEQNDSSDEIFEKIKSSKRILMTLHYGPDGDSIGSCLAMKYFLERYFNKKVRLVSYDNADESMRELDYIKEIEFGTDISEVDYNEFDLILFLDCGDNDYMSGKLNRGFEIPKNIFTINIDHHKTNTCYADLNYVDSGKSSTCSVLIELFRLWDVKFDKILSDRLLLGVTTDSGFFTYENAEQALDDAVFLIKNNADYSSLLKKVLYNQPLKLKRFEALLIDRLKINKNKKHSFGYCLVENKDIEKLGLNKAEVRLGINNLQFIKEFDFVFNLVEFEDHIKGSFRSKKGVDVSLFAKELGGGGHKEAAAFRLDKIDLYDAEKKVLDVIDKILKKS